MKKFWFLPVLLVAAATMCSVALASEPLLATTKQTAVFDVVASEAIMPTVITINGLTLLELVVIATVFFGLVTIKPVRRMAKENLAKKSSGFRSLFETDWQPS